MARKKQAIPVQNPQGNSLGQMGGVSCAAAPPYPQCAGHAQHPRAGAGRQGKAVHGRFHQIMACGVERAMLVQQRA